jgi:hypothetical protein
VSPLSGGGVMSARLDSLERAHRAKFFGFVKKEKGLFLFRIFFAGI